MGIIIEYIITVAIALRAAFTDGHTLHGYFYLHVLAKVPANLCQCFIYQVLAGFCLSSFIQTVTTLTLILTLLLGQFPAKGLYLSILSRQLLTLFL